MYQALPDPEFSSISKTKSREIEVLQLLGNLTVDIVVQSATRVGKHVVGLIDRRPPGCSVVIVRP